MSTGTTRMPRPYRPRVPLWWWVRRRSYFAFVMRELSAVFVAWFVVFLLLLVCAVAAGSEAYQRFLDLSARPWMVALNVVAFGFVVFHAVTWFRLAPQAMVVRVRGKRLPARQVTAAHFVAWAVVSVFVAWLVMR